MSKNYVINVQIYYLRGGEINDKDWAVAELKGFLQTFLS